LAELSQTDPVRAATVVRRAQEAVERLAREYPGDAKSGILDPERAEVFEEFANDEPCPVLDPVTGLCDLYAARPMTCRVFGPPLRTDEGLGVCELCFVGATPEEIAAAEVQLDCEEMEAALTHEAEAESGLRGETIVAWALARF
jgi:Fe-S-cluster containining protein